MLFPPAQRTVYKASVPRRWTQHSSRANYFFILLFFFQFDLQLGGLSSLYSYGHFDRPGEGLHRHELVVAGRNVADSEFAVGAGDRVVGVVHHVDPAFHPAMRVAVDAD